MQMRSNKPYLLRAFYEWITDCECTPILVIDADHPRCKVPQEFVVDGEIVMNISSIAIRDIKLGNDAVEFKASFSGVIHIIYAPLKAILALYAEENNEGIFFDAEDEDDDEVEESRVQLTSIQGTAIGEQNPSMSESTTEKSPERPRPVFTLVEK